MPKEEENMGEGGGGVADDKGVGSSAGSVKEAEAAWSGQEAMMQPRRGSRTGHAWSRAARLIWMTP